MLINAWIAVTVLATIIAYFTITGRIDTIIGGFASLIMGSLSAYGALSLSAVEGGTEKLVASPELTIVGLGIVIIGVVYLFDAVVGSLDLGRLRGSR
jgi:hypothetical protein